MAAWSAFVKKTTDLPLLPGHCTALPADSAAARSSAVFPVQSTEYVGVVVVVPSGSPAMQTASEKACPGPETGSGIVIPKMMFAAPGANCGTSGNEYAPCMASDIKLPSDNCSGDINGWLSEISTSTVGCAESAVASASGVISCTTKDPDNFVAPSNTKASSGIVTVPISRSSGSFFFFFLSALLSVTSHKVISTGAFAINSMPDLQLTSISKMSPCVTACGTSSEYVTSEGADSVESDVLFNAANSDRMLRPNGTSGFAPRTAVADLTATVRRAITGSVSAILVPSLCVYRVYRAETKRDIW